MLIIGITGTLGAGKGTIVEYLVNKGFKHYSAREFITKETKKRKLPVDRKNLVDVGNKLRKEHGPSFVVDQLYKKAQKSNKNSVIESLRTPGEVESLRKNSGFFLFAVDAEPKLRYQRIYKRGSETDKITYKEFMESEKKEFSSTDPNKQNLSQCIIMADYKFKNNDTIETLNKKVEKVLHKINKLNGG